MLCTLLAGCRLEPDHALSGHSSAVFDLNALRLGPLTHLSGVERARRFPAPAAGGPAGTTARPRLLRFAGRGADAGGPRDQRVAASSVPGRSLRSGRASAVEVISTRSSSVTMLVSSRMLVTFERLRSSVRLRQSRRTRPSRRGRPSGSAARPR